jgi:hypothetical protein
MSNKTANDLNYYGFHSIRHLTKRVNRNINFETSIRDANLSRKIITSSLTIQIYAEASGAAKRQKQKLKVVQKTNERTGHRLRSVLAFPRPKIYTSIK